MMIASLARILLTQWLLRKSSFKCPPETASAPPLGPSRVADFGDGLDALPPVEAEENAPCKCPPYGPLALVGHCLQHVLFVALLFFFINFVGQVQVWFFVPFKTLYTIYKAPNMSHAMKKNTEYLRNVLFISLFTQAAHIVLTAFVLDYVRQLLFLDTLEKLVIGCVPGFVLDSWNFLTSFLDSFFK